MSDWVHINADNTVTWPSGDMSTETASRTTTQGAALGGRMNALGVTTIKGVMCGDTHTLGTLTIYAYDGATVMREYATPNSSTSNMAVNYSQLDFSFPGGFSAKCDTATTCDIYVHYEYAASWTS